jgi:hypothetical protein
MELDTPTTPVTVSARPAAPEKRRPRVLVFIVSYPTFSETYMHEEMRSLLDEYDIGIVTYRASDYPRRNALRYTLIRYRDVCPVYGRFPDLNRDFTNPAQQDFLAKLGKVIRAFQPDVLHAHYLGLAAFLRPLAEQFRLPFTIRTHSMDILSEPAEKLAWLSALCNTPWCLRVLTFPAFREQLIAAGMAPDKPVACWPVINFPRFYLPDRRPPTRRDMCGGPSIRKKAHKDFIELAALMKGSGFEFDLYGRGPAVAVTQPHNEKLGNVAQITYADPDDMPQVYPRYDWIVYPADPAINKVGLPASIAEAQAAGLGVCWQELPGRREEQLDYLGGAGFLFHSIAEVPSILARPYPEEMRLRGLDNARKCDIREHKHLLTDVWQQAIAAPGSTSLPAAAEA